MQALLLAILTVSLAQAQAPKDPFLEWMDRIAQRQLAARQSEIGRIKGKDDAERRKQAVRAKVLELIGGLPDYNGPLNARVTGRIDGDGTTIEKILFESLPGLYVTANLYRPSADGKYPAVLLPLGHWEQGKPAVQRIAANLAAKGFVVLAYDPLGQGERLQAYDARLGRSLAGGATDQHFMAGAQALLIGQSFARHRIWDGKRALDYLVSRPEVDASRIGCTGCSGGGTLATFISALDPRIKVAAPACYMNSFKVMFTGPVGDSEQSLPGFLSSGLDETDFVEMFAPKPWLISSTLGDFFTPEGAREVYEESRRWYGIYGAGDRIKWVVGPGGHGTPLEVREAIYEWMIRWLKNGEGDPREQPVKLYPDHLLWVTKTGQVADEPNARDVVRVIQDDYRALKKPGTRADMIAELRRLVAPPAASSGAVRVLGEKATEELIEQRVAFESEPGIELTGTLLIPRTNTRKGGVLLAGASPMAAKFARAGRVVMTVEPRGLPVPATQRGVGDWLPNCRAWLIGRNLPGMRAFDLLRAVDVLAARDDVDVADIRAYAPEVRGVWLLMAASIDPRLRSVWLDRTPYSLASALDGPLHYNLHDAVIPGFALHWDLADMVAAMGSRAVYWSDPADWLRRTVALQGNYRYRYFEEPDETLVAEFLK